MKPEYDPLRHAVQEGFILIVYWVEDYLNSPKYRGKVRYTRASNISMHRINGKQVLAFPLSTGNLGGYAICDDFYEMYGTKVKDADEATRVADNFAESIRLSRAFMDSIQSELTT